MGRPIGARIIEVVTIIEAIGPSRSREVLRRMDDMGKDNASKYLDRAQRRGWVTVEGALYKRIYTAVPGWQDKIDGYETGIRNKPVVSLAALHPLQQVWR